MIVGGGDNIAYEETTWGRATRAMQGDDDTDDGDDAHVSPGVVLVEIG